MADHDAHDDSHDHAHADHHDHGDDHAHEHADDHDHSGHDHTGHSHAHGGHGHSHAPASFGRAFAVGITLNSGFVIVELIYGFFAHSLALVADAGHNLSDVLGLALAWWASVLARRAVTARRTYGMRRSSVLAALGNAMFLLVSVGAIAWSAVMRLVAPTPVAAPTMIWVALLGIAINAGTALMFMSGRKGDLNIRGAFMHMVADALISAGVVVAGLVIVFTNWFWLDPAVSLVLAAGIAFGSWELMRDSMNLALDAVPTGIDPSRVRAYLLGLPAVCDIHHLHIWGLSTTESALTVHVVITDYSRCDALLQEITHELGEHFHIGHATVQFEAVSEQECAARNC